MRKKVRPEDFQEAFQNRAGSYKPSREAVNPELTQAASTVLNYHSSNELRSSADLLLGDVLSGKISEPHAGNAALQNQKVSDIEVQPESKSVPLPTDEEFDI